MSDHSQRQHTDDEPRTTDFYKKFGPGVCALQGAVVAGPLGAAVGAALGYAALYYFDDDN